MQKADELAVCTWFGRLMENRKTFFSVLLQIFIDILNFKSEVMDSLTPVQDKPGDR